MSWTFSSTCSMPGPTATFRRVTGNWKSRASSTIPGPRKSTLTYGTGSSSRFGLDCAISTRLEIRNEQFVVAFPNASLGGVGNIYRQQPPASKQPPNLRVVINRHQEHAFDLVKCTIEIHEILLREVVPVEPTLPVGWVEIEQGRGPVVLFDDLLIGQAFDLDTLEASVGLLDDLRQA